MNTFSNPQVIAEQFPIYAGQKVADFGAGTGAYALILADKVTNTGMVYAIDIQKKMVERLGGEARKEHKENLHPVWGDIDNIKGSRLRDESVQVVLIANTLFQTEYPQKALEEAKRVLAPQGNLIIIDWAESFGNIGPEEDHIISQDRAEMMATNTGFEVERSIAVGDHHYGFIAKKQKTEKEETDIASALVV